MSRSTKALRVVPCALLVAAAVAQTAVARDHREAVGGRAAASIPSALVGTWTSSEGAAELIYVFSRDGTYKHAGVLLQERPSGMFSFQVGARGTVTVRGRTLVLRPQRGFQQLEDPDSPSSNYRRPISRRPERYRWRLVGFGSSASLQLTDSRTRVTVVYHRR